MSFQEWKKQQHPQFLYWLLVLDLEISVSAFVIEISQDFQIQFYMQSIEGLLPWSFLLDHYHYAHSLSVHLQDMKELPTKAPVCPEIAQAFVAGKLSPEVTQRVLIALDQAHEQMNKMVRVECLG